MKKFSPPCMKIPLDPSPCPRVYFQIRMPMDLTLPRLEARGILASSSQLKLEEFPHLNRGCSVHKL